VTSWLEDISTAIEELKNCTGSPEIWLVGLRLGATLALLASLRRDDIGGLVLWDPVENGKEYLKELLQLEKEASRLHSRQMKHAPMNHMDILGFRFSRLFRSEVEQINLLETGPVPAKKALIIRGCEKQDDDALLAHLARSTGSVEQQHVAVPPLWEPNKEGSLLVPARLLQSIVSWSCQACS
jgi:pimeloyl-ACP methyl ester carboxylesterase